MIRRPPRSTRTDTLLPYTTLFRSALALRRKRCLLTRLLPPGFNRLSTMCMAGLAPPSTGLFHADIPFDQAPDLPLRIAPFDHARDEFIMLGRGFAVLLRPEADDRQQILDLAEHPLFDDRSAEHTSELQ